MPNTLNLGVILSLTFVAAMAQAAGRMSPDAATVQGDAEAPKGSSECGRLSLADCAKAARSIEGTDMPRAARMYAEICEKGDLSRCYRATILFDRSSNRERSSSRAVSLGSRSCKGGIAHDCFAVGMILFYGRADLPKDQAAADRLYAIGCDAGDDDSCAELSAAYAKGLGVPRDVARSKELRKKAEALGYRGE
jgi:TPR repeat protein